MVALPRVRIDVVNCIHDCIDLASVRFCHCLRSSPIVSNRETLHHRAVCCCIKGQRESSRRVRHLIFTVQELAMTLIEKVPQSNSVRRGSCRRRHV